MATYKIKTNQKLNVNGIPIRPGLSIELKTKHSNPFNELDQIHEGYKKEHGIDFTSCQVDTLGYFQYEKI